jgi:parallel beta-helix repeat protein
MRPRAAALTALALCALGALTFAGPLSPPGGPITSTYKTLTEVEPRIAVNATNTPGNVNTVYQISQPGSYYLTGNLTGVSGESGIYIAASDVTLDLNGFTLQGVAGSAYGIQSAVGGGLQRVTVRNGSVNGWGQAGVDLGFNAGGKGCLIENIHTSGNNNGIRTTDQGVVRACTAIGNTNTGITVGLGGTAENCVARSNTGSGFVLQGDVVVRGCSAYGNSIHGFTTSNPNGLVVDCVADGNTQNGINANQSINVQRCTASGNTGDGIFANGSCKVEGCFCSGNGSATVFSAGIRCQSSNQITGNTCISNHYGFRLESNGNFVARNMATGNTVNWSSAVNTNNVILVVAGVTSGLVSGNSGGASPGSTDPNANFSY